MAVVLVHRAVQDVLRDVFPLGDEGLPAQGHVSNQLKSVGKATSLCTVCVMLTALLEVLCSPFSCGSLQHSALFCRIS